MTGKQIAKGTEVGFDLRALRKAVEERDLDALLGFYAEDVELRVVNPALPRGQAFELEGRTEVGKYLRAVGNGKTRRALKRGAVYGERAIGFVEQCQYPDGARVSVETMLEIEGGLIVRQVDAVRPVDGEWSGDGAAGAWTPPFERTRQYQTKQR